MTAPLKIDCCSGFDFMIIDSEKDQHYGDGQIEIQNHFGACSTVLYIDKPKAIQIVSHLIKVFDITPEQRNK